MGLYVVLAIVAIVFAILLCPICLNIEFCESLSVNIKILFFKFTLFPRKNNKKEKVRARKSSQEAKLDKKSKDNKIKDLLKQRGLRGFLNILKEMGKIVLGVGEKFKSKVKIDDLDVLVSVADEDSAKTAVRYGQTCAVIFPFTNIILKYFDVKNYSVKVRPDFMEDKSTVNFNLKLHLKLITLIYIALWAIIKFIKSLY